MPYPSRPRRDALPEFAGSRGRWLPPGSAKRLTDFVVASYTAGRSLWEISELVDRSHREVANILRDEGIPATAGRRSASRSQASPST
jgi:hypothetical protein